MDFICRAMEPVVRNLAQGGSIALNVSNDLFLPGSPARSLYLERLVLALADRFGLHLMDRLVWENKSKPPGPMQWASKTRQQLNVSYEHVLWMCNDPPHCKADNRRVLLPHSDRQQRLIAQGGEKRQVSYADGAYTLRHGSYGKPTAGRIPRNILSFGHSCPDHMEYRRDAVALGLPAHGAPMPLTLARFLISFLTEPGDLVVDQFGGKLTTARAAEELGRKWVVAEWILDYVRAAAERFRRSAAGFEMSEWFSTAAMSGEFSNGAH